MYFFSSHSYQQIFSSIYKFSYMYITNTQWEKLVLMQFSFINFTGMYPVMLVN